MRRLSIAALLAVAVYAFASTDAAAQRKRSIKKSPRITRCVKYQQKTAGDTGMWLELRNQCSFPVACELSWQVQCDGDPAPAPRTESSRLELGRGATDAALADTSACGVDGGWTVSDVRWSCEKQ